MKLEAVDKRNAVLIRVATISDTEDHRIKVYTQMNLYCLMNLSLIRNQHGNTLFNMLVKLVYIH